MKRDIRILICVCAALGWWGLLYPELALTPDTYRLVGEDNAVQESEEVIEWNFGSDIYWKMLDAERGQVRMRSKLLDSLSALMERKAE